SLHDASPIYFYAFQRMLEQMPKLERYFRIILEGYLGTLQRRLVFNNVYDAEYRYLDFVRTYPEMAAKIPQYLIASYLGISAEFLSRDSQIGSNKVLGNC